MRAASTWAVGAAAICTRGGGDVCRAGAAHHELDVLGQLARGAVEWIRRGVSQEVFAHQRAQLGRRQAVKLPLRRELPRARPRDLVLRHLLLSRALVPLHGKRPGARQQLRAAMRGCGAVRAALAHVVVALKEHERRRRAEAVKAPHEELPAQATPREVLGQEDAVGGQRRAIAASVHSAERGLLRQRALLPRHTLFRARGSALGAPGFAPRNVAQLGGGLVAEEAVHALQVRERAPRHGRAQEDALPELPRQQLLRVPADRRSWGGLGRGVRVLLGPRDDRAARGLAAGLLVEPEGSARARCPGDTHP